MKITIKAIHELIRKDYPFRSDAVAVRDHIANNGGLASLLRKFPHLGYSVEYVTLEHKDGSEKEIAYINSGDTYTPTLMRNLNGNIVICDLGTFIETLPATWTAK